MTITDFLKPFKPLVEPFKPIFKPVTSVMDSQRAINQGLASPVAPLKLSDYLKPATPARTSQQAIQQGLASPIKPIKPLKLTDYLKPRIEIKTAKDILPGLKQAFAIPKDSGFLELGKDIKDVIGAYKSGFQSGTLSTASAVEQAGSVFFKKIGDNQMSWYLQHLSDKDEELAKVGVNVLDNKKFSEGIRDPKWIARGLGMNLPNMLFALGVATPFAVAGAPIAVTGAVAVGSAGILEGGFAYKEAKNSGADDKTAEKVASIVGIVNGLLEALPITRVLTRSPMGKTVKNKILTTATKRIVEQAVGEGGTESLQEIVSNSVAKVYYDDKRNVFAGVPESAFFGALVGGVTSAGIDTITGMPVGLTIEDVSGKEEKPITQPLAQEAMKYKSAEVGQYLYHGTSEGKLRSIRTEGLKGGQAIGSEQTGYGKGIFFGDTEQQAISYASRKSFASEPRLMRIKVENPNDFIPDTNVVSAGDFKTLKNIPAEKIEVKIGKEWMPIQRYYNMEKNILPLDKKILKLELDFEEGKITKQEYNQTKSQLTDFYQATKGVEVKPTDTILKEIKSDIIKKIYSKLNNKAYIKSITKQEIKSLQEQVIDVLESSNLEANDKAKFLRAVKNIQTAEQLQKQLPIIEERISNLEQAEFKRGIIGQINEELKSIKPVKKGMMKVSRYDYETNNFLQELKDINKYTQEKAQEELLVVRTEDLSQADLIKNRLLSFRANGAKSSLALQAQVLADIQDLKAIGEEAKDELDFQKKLERQDKKDEVLKGIVDQKPSKVILKQLKSGYISSVSNLYSAINAMAGKNIADRYDYAIHQTNSKQDSFVKTEELKGKAKEIYGVESDRQLTKIFIDDLAKKDYKITDTEGLSEDLSKFDLMNVYNGIKNDLIKERYYNFFGEEQVISLLQNLTPEDAQLADHLMKEVQSYKDVLNQRSIEIKGMDNGTVENYWPSVSEYMPEFFDDIKIQGEMPSATKERSKSSRVIPRMANAWLLSQKHIAEAEHVKTVSRKYEELKNLFADRTIRKTIETKYGNDAYQSLMKHIETFSLNYRTGGLDIISGIYSSALNNWVKAKIASPTVFARQMISSIYAIESVGIKDFTKYQAEFVANPSKAFKYMWDNLPFVRNRFKMGYSEALEDVIRGTKKMSVGMDSITKYTTLMTRGGDITAIMINGYPIIKTEMAKHGDMEKAIDVFQKFSEKTQQSPTNANLSDLQRNKGAWHRTFFRFKNTTNQLLRLQVDANIQFVNNQISVKDYTTKTLLYSVYTPIMYVLFGYAITQGWKKLFGTDDEEETKSLLGDFLQNIIIQPFQAIPFLDMATEATYNKIRQKITGKSYNYGMFSYPLFDDIETAWSKLFKKEPSAMDLMEAFSLIQEPATGIPTGTIIRYFKYTQDDTGVWGDNKSQSLDDIWGTSKNKPLKEIWK